VDTGKIRYATLDMPLESIHKFAFKAAEATHCAQDQGKFWEMSHRLFEQQKALEPWKAHAEALGLDVAKFEECMSSDRHAPAIRKDMAEAAKAGVTGTPGFLIAVADPSSKTKVKGVTTLRGAQPYDRFKAELDQVLAGAEGKSGTGGK
jgi:predicted DsbA family dithiol-disulfide isomerase